MRTFQNFGLYSAYRNRFNLLAACENTFSKRIACFKKDGFGAAHRLIPPTEKTQDIFFTNGDDEHGQRMWARQHGMHRQATLQEILLAQIEAHQTEIFYNLDPVRFPSSFIAKLPGCVKKSIAWRAAPSQGSDFSAYSLVVCNFPSLLTQMNCDGCSTAYFSPAHDALLDPFAQNENRPIDVAFVGGYSRHHQRRGKLLEVISESGERFTCEFYLNQSRSTRLAESVFGRMLPLESYRRPRNIRRIAHEPVFGVELLSVLSRSKIVLNGAIDMAGEDRGNMRCFEALGCRSLLLTDAGKYPEGMVNNQTMVTYKDPNDALSAIERILSDWPRHERIANDGYSMIVSNYSKKNQWDSFVSLVG